MVHDIPTPRGSGVSPVKSTFALRRDAGATMHQFVLLLLFGIKILYRNTPHPQSLQAILRRRAAGAIGQQNRVIGEMNRGVAKSVIGRIFDDLMMLPGDSFIGTDRANQRRTIVKIRFVRNGKTPRMIVPHG